MGWALMVAGLLVALTASNLLVLSVIGASLAVALGILGIGLIAVSGRWMPTKPQVKPKTEPVEQIVQTIYSPDRQMRALVRQLLTHLPQQSKLRLAALTLEPRISSLNKLEMDCSKVITSTPWPGHAKSQTYHR